MASVTMGASERPKFDHLREGSVGVAGTVFQSVTGMAPASAVAFSIGVTAVYAGLASPLAVILAAAACILVGICIGQLAKHLTSAGGLYTYISRALGPAPGFLAAWCITLLELLVTPIVCLLLAWLMSTVFKDNIGLNLGWVIWVLLALALIFFLTYTDVRLSTRAGALLGLFEIAVITVLSVWMIVKNANHLSSTPFDPSSVPGAAVSGLFKGMVFGVLAFGGFEAVAALGEESRRPTFTIPRALIFAPLAMGLFYLLGIYGWIAGVGTKNFVAQATTGGNPWLHLGRVFWGEGWILVFLALVNSNFAAGNAQVTATARIFYAMGRNGILPSAFARTHPKHKTPHIATAVTVIASAIIALLAGAKWGTLVGFAVLGTAYGITIILLYGAVAISAGVFYIRERRPAFNPILHAVIPAAVIVLLGFALYYQYSPLPPSPLVVGNWIVVGWFAAGLIAMAAAMHWLPDGLRRARTIFVDQDVGPLDTPIAADRELITR